DKNKDEHVAGSVPTKCHIPKWPAVSEKDSSTSRSVSRSSIHQEEKSGTDFKTVPAGGQIASSSTSLLVSANTSPASILDACDKLIDICDYMGFIGHSLKAIIGKATEYHMDIDKMFKVFLEPDSIMVMDMALVKLKNDANVETDARSKEKLLKVFKQTQILTDYLKAPTAAADETKEKETEKAHYG
ncbi:unnamed protein product, partial [Meganyctiphanes norvegica]